MAEKPLLKNVGLHRRPRGSGDKGNLVEKPLLLSMCWRENKGKKTTTGSETLMKVPLLHTTTNEEQGQNKKKPGLQSQSNAADPFAPRHRTRSLSWQQSSSINSGSWNWSMAGTPGGTWPPPQQKMPGRGPGQPGLHTLPTAAECCWGLQ